MHCRSSIKNSFKYTQKEVYSKLVTLCFISKLNITCFENSWSKSWIFEIRSCHSADRLKKKVACISGNTDFCQDMIFCQFTCVFFRFVNECLDSGWPVTSMMSQMKLVYCNHLRNIHARIQRKRSILRYTLLALGWILSLNAIQLQRQLYLIALYNSMIWLGYNR